MNCKECDEFVCDACGFCLRCDGCKCDEYKKGINE